MSREALGTVMETGQEAAVDAEEVKRIDLLEQIFLDHLPAGVLTDLGEVQRMERIGPSLIRVLEGIRARHRLNPIEADSATTGHDDIIRIVCGDGLV